MGPFFLKTVARYTFKDYPEILEQVEKGQVFPVYLIFGDPHLGARLFRELISRLVPPELEPFQVERVAGEGETLSSILDRVRTFPLLPGRKVVAVKNPFLLFSAASKERLLQKAEEAWGRGDRDLTGRLLLTFFKEAGISGQTGEGKGALEAWVKEKWFDPRGESFPEWLKEALAANPELALGDSPVLSPERQLESALKGGFPPGHTLILWLEGPTEGKGLTKIIEKHGAAADLTGPSGKKGGQSAALKGLMKARLAREGKTIHARAEALLLEKIGGETALLEAEMDKLIAYVGERRQILPEDVEETVGAAREEPLYELTAVLGEKKLGDALKKLGKLEDQGYNPLQILAGIANALRRLLAAREVLTALPAVPPRAFLDYGTFTQKILPHLQKHPLPDSLSRSHPFVLFQTLKTARSFSDTFLIRALKNILDTDHLIKSGGGDPSLLLKDFLIFFCTKADGASKGHLTRVAR